MFVDILLSIVYVLCQNMYYCDAYATLPILLRSIKKQTIIIYEKLLDYRCLCLLVSIPHVGTVATNKQLLVLECLH